MNAPTPLDEFTQKRLRDGLADRFQRVRRLADNATRATRIGGLILEFDDDELAALQRSGFLTFGDMADLRAKGHLS